MPRLQDIERFKQDLASLAHEGEVLERWGEALPVIEPPGGEEAAQVESLGGEAEDGRALESETSDAELGALLEPFPEEEPPPGDIAPESEAPADALDFGDLLESPPSGPQEAPTAEEDAFDLASFGDLSPFDESPTPSEVPAEEAAGIGAEPLTTKEFSEEPPQDAGGEAEELLSFEEAPTAEPEGAGFELPDLDAFDLSPPPEGGAEPAAGADEFSIPDMGFAEEAPESEAPTQEAEGLASFGDDEPSPPAEEALSLGGALDSFESFSFEEGGGGLGPENGESASSALSFEREIAALSDEAPPAAEETFSLDQDWSGFDEVPGAAPPPRQAPARPAGPAAGGAPEEKARPVALTEGQVDRLQDNLLAYPLNLRVAVEDILANEKGTEAQRSRIVWGMVEGMPLEDLAFIAGRILKRRIQIPRGYEKKTGASIEAERGTFRYAFVHTVLPVLKVGFLVLAVTALLGWMCYRYIYIPLAANALYRQGYQLIAEDRYSEADATFDRATGKHEFIAWYYRYAEAYRAHRQYILAEKKYEALLNRHPKESAGALDWARLERDQLKYDSAVKVIRERLLSWDYFNKDGLLLLGDIYLDWADEDPKWFEQARRSYAALIQRYGGDDLYLGRMLRYFIRTDNLKEVLPLKARFLGEKKNPLDALSLAELGGYLMDKGMLEDVNSILQEAARKDSLVPEAHFELARYFRHTASTSEERKALDNAVSTYRALPALTAKRTAGYIESLIWRGRFRIAESQWIGAEEDFTAAASAYEDAVELRRLPRGARFHETFAAEAYAGLAEVALRQRADLESALRLYKRAEANGYDTADTRYKRGYILYKTARYADSLEQFHRAGRLGSEGPYLSFAFGAALYARQDWSAAEGYFRKVKQVIGDEIAGIDSPVPREDSHQAELVTLLMKADNNLGAALYNVANRLGNAALRSKAYSAFAAATRGYDELGLGSAVSAMPEDRNLGLLNMNLALNPRRGVQPVVYAEIERDMDFPKRLP